MEQIKQDLHRLCAATGVAGQRDVRELCQELFAGITDEVTVDAMGNLLAWRRCAAPTVPTVLLEAHLDEIGFLVTHIDEGGFIHVAPAGGVDQRVLTAQRVIVYGDRPYPGVFCSIPPHLAKQDGELPEMSARGIDIGLTKEEAEAHISLGSRVGFAPVVRDLQGERLSAKALDNRAGIAAILHCLRQLDYPLPVNVAVALCVQEELGCRGALPAVRRVNPAAAIVTDVSFALTPDASPIACGKMGKGAMIGISPILDEAMTRCMQALAHEKSISWQAEVMGGTTGTDADQISKALLGVPTALLSIPLRYMHTPVETVDLRDIAAVGDLMAAYIEGGAANE